MKETTDIYSFGYYDNYIQTNFIIDHCGLSKLGKRTFENVIKVDLESPTLLEIEKLREEIKTIIQFVQTAYSQPSRRPLWYKINILDQAINEYVGIGFLNLEGDWLNFIIEYLNIDRAEQGGDTMFTLFDINFKWTVCFTLSQDDSVLQTEKYER